MSQEIHGREVSPLKPVIRDLEESGVQLFNLNWVKCHVASPNAPLLTKCTVISRNTDFAHNVKGLIEAKGIDVVTLDLDADLTSQLDSMEATGTLLYLAGHEKLLSASDIVAHELHEFESLRLIANKVAECRHEAKPQLWILTQGVQVFGEQFDTVGLSGSGLWGLGRVIAREYPIVETGLIDLPFKRVGDEEIALVLAIMTNESEQREFLIDDQCIWQRQVGSLAISHEKAEIKQDANYLITGGFGETGRMLAADLFAAGARHVTLMGRSAPPANLITESEQRKAQNFNLYLFQGDIADIEDVKAVLRRIDRTGHPLRGIYHLASVAEDGVLATLNSHSVEKIFRPKIAGTWNLHLVTQGLSLDWFIAFSSLTGIIGVAGQGAYAAANSFVDSLMRYRLAAGLPGTAIAWEPWRGGMTTRLNPLHLSRLEAMGLLFLDIQDVMDTVTRENIHHYPGLIAGNFSRVALERLIDSREPVNGIETALGAAQSGDAMVTVGQPSHEEQRNAMTEIVIEELKKLVAGGKVTADTKLSEIDMDSMSAVAIAQRLRGNIGKLVPISVFFDDCSISEVVEKLKRYF
ncbi:beta-ketoacyl reductase [Photorhabdus temperata]|uniref:Dehydrogenase n=1 Tax=Photorhabdus temperata subsp. temperata Meg1 TaxID=1393735 RepID=A0A081RZI6_PHOTE|nr:beta-ketoacyl reductase [Photorhabdus temperata]KER04089.1 dehydrogenase [Photorhabdus temperata subsp. temperata Meg1]MCT8347285.1 beta-ketoacyl reductase [Photorhabdus temperata]